VVTVSSVAKQGTWLVTAEVVVVTAVVLVAAVVVMAVVVGSVTSVAAMVT
jgi:hypothetical protein